MTFWRKDILAEPAATRADVIIQKKRRKQVPNAKGLGAVTIPRNGPRAVHQRNEDRHVLRGTRATADIAGETHEISVLNLSSNGVMIAYEGDLDIGQQVFVAIDDCAPITTAVRWVRGGKVGLEFIAETVILAQTGVQDYIVKTIRREAEATGMAATLRIGTEQRNVSKRHPLVFLGKMCWKQGEAIARLRNISSSGAMVALADPVHLAKDDAVTLSLMKAGDLAARIRWIADREVGLAFDQAFDVSLLINENAAELAPLDDLEGLPSSMLDEPTEDDFDSVKIRLGNIRNPHRPPEMRYGKLTLDEVYATLYRNGLPKGW